jgi:glycyl-tRNA synthetase alpha subunit
LAKKVAELYYQRREELGFPVLRRAQQQAGGAE